MKHLIETKNAPVALGTYSQAVHFSQTIYVSGQIPICPDSMAIVSDDTSEQIEQTLDNVAAILEEAGSSINKVLKFTVFLTNLENFHKVNEIMANRLMEPYPARTVAEVSALPKGAKVEIDAIAIKN